MTIPENDNLLAPLLELFAGFRLEIGSLTTELQRANRLEQRRLAEQPNYIPFSRVSNNATTTDMIDFGGPQGGRQWNIKVLTGYSSTLATNAAVASWYVGQRVGINTMVVSDLRWQFGSFPFNQDFAPGVITVLPNQQLICGLTSIPASSVLFLNAIIDDQPMATGLPVIDV